MKRIAIRVASRFINADDAVERMKMEFPYHDVIVPLDNAYDGYAAHSYDEMTPDVVLRAFKRAYKPWKAYLRDLKREARSERRLKPALQAAEKAEQYFRELEARPLKEWQGGFVTLLARLKRAHEAIYNADRS